MQLWIWAPAGAKKGDKLPVHVYTQCVLILLRHSLHAFPTLTLLGEQRRRHAELAVPEQ